MAGHSHWAGIKHKKGRQDKARSNLFSKLSREITVAAKLGAKDPESNPRLRSAIQAAKQSNMPKDNIERAISKSEINSNDNYENLRYEGFGPFNVAFATLRCVGEPKDLANISLTPAASSTCLAAPPAITPVPGAAGLSKTSDAP